MLSVNTYAMQHHFTHLTAKGMLIVTSLCKFTATGLQSHLTLYFTGTDEHSHIFL